MNFVKAVAHGLRPRRHLVPVIIVLAAVVIISTMPSLFRLTDGIIGDGGDNYEYASYLQIAKDNLIHGRHPFAYSLHYRYPDGFSFNIGADAKLFVVLGGLASIYADPQLVYNVMLLSILFVNAWVSTLFFTAVTSSVSIGIIGGIIYGISYYTLSRGGGHVNIMQIYAFPLGALAVLHTVRQQAYTWKWTGIFFAAAYLSFLSSVQYGVMFILSSVCIGILALLVYPEILIHPRHWTRRRPAIVITCLLIFMLFFVGTFSEHIIRFGTSRQFLPEVHSYEFLHSAFFRPSLYVHSLLSDAYQSVLPMNPDNGLTNSMNSSLFLGYVEIILFVLFFLIRRDRRALFLLLSWTVFMALATGKIFSLFPTLHLEQLAPFTIISETERWFPVHYLFFATCATLALQHLMRRRGAAVILIIALLIVLERASINYHSQPNRQFTNQPYQEVVRQLPGSGVLDIPIITIHADTGKRSHYNYLPFEYNKNIVSGYFHWVADVGKYEWFTTSHDSLRRLTCDETVEAPGPLPSADLRSILLAQGINSVVVHKDMLNTAGCENVNRLLEEYPIGIIMDDDRLETEVMYIYTDSSVDIYRL